MKFSFKFWLGFVGAGCVLVALSAFKTTEMSPEDQHLAHRRCVQNGLVGEEENSTFGHYVVAIHCHEAVLYSPPE